MWETLEGMVREKAQEFIQQIMEEEVTELLGREKSERRSTVDSAEGYRNGYGKPRRLAMSSGTIMLRRPRVRGVEERFESRVLPLFARRDEGAGCSASGAVSARAGGGRLRAGDAGPAGRGGPVVEVFDSAAAGGMDGGIRGMSKRSLADREVVYVWADGIYVKAGLERDKAALLVVLGAMRDGTKEVLALRSGYRESVESWSEVLRDLKARGIEAPRLLMADGNAAIWGAVRQVWPEAGEQRCWNHKMRNVLDRLPQREQSEAKNLLRAVVYAPSRSEAVKAREVFARRYRPVVSEGGGRTRGRLGADGGVLRLPRGSLEASTHDERGREPVRCGTAQDDGGEAIQAGRERYGADLEVALGGREAVPKARRSSPPQGRCLKEGSSKTENPSQPNSGRMPPDTFTHLLTQPRRLSAVCQLRYRDLRLGEGAHGSIRWPADTDKQGRETVVPIGPRVRQALDRLLRERPGIGAAPLFPSPEKASKPITRHLADKWLREGERLAVLEPLSGSLWHAYRRKWATERKHLPDVDVAAAGGWKSLQALKASYQHADAETMLRVVLGAGELREAR